MEALDFNVVRRDTKVFPIVLTIYIYIMSDITLLRLEESSASLRLAECAQNLYPSLLSLVESSNMLRSSVAEGETRDPICDPTNDGTCDSNTTNNSLTASMEHFTSITNDEHVMKCIKER